MKNDRTHPPNLQAPLGPAVRCIRRGEDSQLRLTWLPTIAENGGLEIRVFRRSLAELETFDAYAPTNAGVIVPRENLRALAGMLREILAETAQEWMALAKAMNGKSAAGRRFETLSQFTHPNRDSHQPVWHAPIRNVVNTVNVERLAQERQDQEKEVEAA